MSQPAVAPARAYRFEQLLAEHKALKLEIDHEWLEMTAFPREEA